MDIYIQLKKYTEFSMGQSNEVCELIYQDTFINGIVFTGYDLNNSSFLEVVFNSCDFSNVYLSGASICGSTFNECIFLKNTFRKGKADYSIFNSTNLGELDSFRTSFYESQFLNVILKDSKLERCYLDESIFSNVKFENVKFLSSTFNNSTFKNVHFINCHFEDSTFQNVTNFHEVHFVDSSITIDGELKNGLSSNEIKAFLE
ncbi:pentapeptide repeat-containing protein [Bacillus sp. FJAT-51639]|uniref:Pentapeptide repeat-containing protein n=1 Tax=Bacillus bruguierae TaxID=3127667 RepID=A0ABU8FMC3_9BACI